MRRPAQANEGALPSGAPEGDTPLRIPFGSNEAGLQLGPATALAVGMRRRA
jgi:hypothetical protein